jgi:hypothetical protein
MMFLFMLLSDSKLQKPSTGWEKIGEKSRKREVGNLLQDTESTGSVGFDPLKPTPRLLLLVALIGPHLD